MISACREHGNAGQTNFSVEYFECTADTIVNGLADLPLDKGSQLRVANTEPQCVDFGDNALSLRAPLDVPLGLCPSPLRLLSGSSENPRWLKKWHG